MHFYKKDGHQVLSLQGDLILSHRKLISYVGKSATPHAVHDAQFAQNLSTIGFIRKLGVFFVVVKFIFWDSIFYENRNN
jgi:hypothetical protein